MSFQHARTRGVCGSVSVSVRIMIAHQNGILQKGLTEMLHRSFHPLALMLLQLVFPSLVCAMGGGLTGRVVDESGSAIHGAHVSLPALQRGSVTDERGRFFLAGLPDGEYALRFSHVGYRVLERLVIVANGENAALPDIRLESVPVDIGEVSVLGTRSDELLRNVPFPVSVAVGEQLLRTPAISVADALDAQPGVALVRDGAWGTDISIRGLGRSNVVSIVDGARIETATNLAAGLSLVDLSDVDRIEVIRGAASMLYGGGATGGVVNISTAPGRYSERFRIGGSLSSGYTSVNNGGNGTLTLDAGADHWYARLHGRLRSADDARTPEGRLRDSRFHDRSMSASAGTRLWEGHEITARYQLTQARDVGIPGGASFPLTASARYPTEERELLTVAYSAPMLLPGVQNFSVRYVRQLIARDAEIVPNQTTVLRPSAKHTMDGVQMQAGWLPGGEHRIIAGVDAWQRSYTGRRIRELKARNTIIADLPLPDATFRSAGVYVQDVMRLFDGATRASIGARADLVDVWNTQAFDLLYTEVNGVRNTAPPNRVLRWREAEYSEVSWSAHAGVVQRLTTAIDATLNLARSWRAPALEERYQYIELGGATYIGDPALRAEKGTCVDVGLRVRTEQFSATANAFLNEMRDLVVDAQRLDTLYVKENVGEARLYGFELASEYSPTPGATAYLGFSFVRGEDIGSGGNLPSIAPATLRMGLRFSAFDAVHGDVRLTVTDDQGYVAAGEKTTPGSGVVDLYLRGNTLRVAGLGVQVFAGIENLFDRPYRRHLSTLRGLVNLEPGRNLFARLRILW
jgi:hemoglobin/transferrin/lactoferrin receptor protein